MEQEKANCKAKNLKPRALILMANPKDLVKILDFIKTLNEVKLVYVTTSQANMKLRVVREPRDKREPFEQALFTLDMEN